MAPKSDQGKESNKKSDVKAEKKILAEAKPVGKKETAIDKTVQVSEPNEPQINFRNPEYYRNRELSWIAFDERCLSEARDRQLVPLFERAKFLSITASNLDEFNMVRVASLKDQVHAGYTKKDIAGMTAAEQLSAISERMHAFVRDQYNTLNRSLIPSFEKAGLEIIADYEELTEAQCAYLDEYFETNIYPILTPMAMDSSRPFPLVRNKTLNIGALIAQGCTSETDQPSRCGRRAQSHHSARRSHPQIYR